MNKPRRHFADSEKVAILKRHLIDKVPVSDLSDELKLYPNQFYDGLHAESDRWNRVVNSYAKRVEAD